MKVKDAGETRKRTTHCRCAIPYKMRPKYFQLEKAYAYALARVAIINCSYIEMREDPGPHSPVEKQQAYKDLIDRMVQNAKWGLEDAIQALEKVDPSWLN